MCRKKQTKNLNIQRKTKRDESRETAGYSDRHRRGKERRGREDLYWNVIGKDNHESYDDARVGSAVILSALRSRRSNVSRGSRTAEEGENTEHTERESCTVDRI
jgi:hypothetical protein